ncbi:hypothetical protein D3C87_321350 [compost metagenome]
MTQPQELSDLIAAASLLLAVLAILFSVWHQPVMDALKRPTKGIPENLKPTRNALGVAFWSKAFPLMLGGALTFLIFLPEIISIIGEVFTCSPASRRYDAVKAAFLLTQAFALGLTIYCTVLGGRLLVHWGRAKTGKR